MKNGALGILIIGVLFSLQTYGKNIVCRHALSAFESNKESLVYEHTNSITYPKVEVYRQNNAMGPQQFGTLTFYKWYDLSFELSEKGDVTSLVGLTKEGAVYNLVQIEGRTLARRLSGQKVFESLQVTNKGQILGLKENGETELYHPLQWMRPAKKEAIKKALKAWALLGAASVAAAQFYPELDLPIEMHLFRYQLFTFNFPLFEVVFTGISGLSSSFIGLFHYERLNTFPDGFSPSDLGFNDHGEWYKNTAYADEEALESFNPPSSGDLAPKLGEEHTQEIFK